jgi:hypothetical protein
VLPGSRWMFLRRRRVATGVAQADEVRDGRLVLLGLGCLAFVAVAVVTELVSSLWANSEVPRWAELAPIAWPPAARAAWWSAVALAALTYRISLARVGLAQRRSVTVLSVVPFAAFAAGIALGVDWATWH